MKNVPATQLQNSFGLYLEESEREVFGITRNGRIKSVLMGIHEYNALKAIERQYVKILSQRSASEDFMSAADTEAYLASIIHLKESGDAEDRNTPKRKEGS